MNGFTTVLLTLFAAGLSWATTLAAQTPIERSLTTGDGISIPAWEYRSPASKGQPFVLLFHQGGASGMAEYSPIAPRIHETGVNVLVIDQRRGGELFGGRNEVAEAFDADQTSYCEALPELEAALDYALSVEPAQRALLWGSSYSAALVIQLAAARPDAVAGVVAFSPASGESMDGCRPEPFAQALDVPLLAVRPASEMEHEWIAQQIEQLAAMGHDTFVADPGAHGSSTLVPERAGGDTEATWQVVLAFIESARRGSAPDPS